jgi:hypothetical protein
MNAGKAITAVLTIGIFAMLFRASDGIGLFQLFCGFGIAFIVWEVAFPRQTGDFYDPDIRRQARRLKEDEQEIMEEIKKRKIARAKQ